MVICQRCGKRQAIFQTHQIVDGRPTIVYFCEVCAQEVRDGAKKTSNLDRYGRDLTELAEQTKLDPVIGRKTEIERIIHILSRRTKNNPVLIGDPGVGKTAIVEGLAQRIVQSTVPEILKGKRIVALDLALMLAGASHRGQFEERLKKTLEEVSKTSGQIILFIDELHTVVGAGAAQGAIDAANMLKPSLSRGEIQVIGATTLDEYRKYIEKDGALERRFQPIMVAEPTKEETIEILYGLKERYEQHHKVKVADSAILAAVELSDRYIADRFLPDKAIDLLDEACARARLSAIKEPENLLKVEEELKKIRAKPNKSLSEERQEEDLSSLKEELTTLWQQTKLEKIPEVVREDIAVIVSQITGIPLSDLSKDERERLMQLEQRLHRRVVGQDEAIKAVAEALRRSRAGLKDPNRPVGSFIFLGPTGVGKTELAKTLAQALYGSEDLIVRLDMSEYMEKHAVSRIIGAPPGYVGFDEAGQLTEVVRRKPFSVILFDEIEKAHPEVFNILLQILEDGRLTDGHGRTVDFRNTIVIMTSNVGSEIVPDKKAGFAQSDDGKQEKDYSELKEELMEYLHKSFRPEFINRVDEIVVFHPLTDAQVKKIVDILIERSAERLEEQGIALQVSAKAKSYLAQKGYDPNFGARPLRRLIQKEVENPISSKIIDEEYSQGDLVIVDKTKNGLVFKLKKKVKVLH